MIKKIFDNLKIINLILTKTQKRLFVFVFLFAIIASVLETVGVTIIVPVVKVMMTPEELLESDKLKPIIFLFSITSEKKMIFFVISGVIVFFIAKNLYLIFFTWFKAKCSSKIQREISVYMMESYMNRGYTYFLDNNPSKIVQGVTSDSISLYVILNMLVNIFVKSFTVLLISIFMICSDLIMALGIMVASLICLLVLILGLKQPMKKIGDLLRGYAIQATKILLQAIYGIKEVLVMRKQKSFIEQYRENMFLRQKQEIKRVVLSESPNYIIEALFVSIIMFALCIRMMTYDDKGQFMAVLASFAMGAFRILPSIGVISGSFGTIMSSKPGLDSIYENIIEARKYNDNFNNVDVQDIKEYENHIFENSIVLENVSFKYSEETDYVLRNLYLEIKKNSSVALIGESGAGKSTIADLILGVLKAEQGNVKIDNIDIRSIPNTWSKLIGFVPQNIYLSDSSIAENVAFGIRKKDIDYEKVKEVLKMANVIDFVNTLSDGIDTVVGDRGARISGGQRQRIGIARALYRDPQILILDEATSALDNETEENVMNAIEDLQGKITMIIIAHRLSTIKNCDKIYEISDKKAIERKYYELT